MSSSIHNLEIVPKSHPLYHFLQRLPTDEACDPNPDWIEEGSSKRLVLAFRGDNASARQRRLCEILTERQPWICKVASHITPGSSFVIIFLQDYQPGADFRAFEAKLDEDNWEPERIRRNIIPFVKPEQLCLPEPKEPAMAGCKQMETYD